MAFIFKLLDKTVFSEVWEIGTKNIESKRLVLRYIFKAITKELAEKIYYLSVLIYLRPAVLISSEHRLVCEFHWTKEVQISGIKFQMQKCCELRKHV